MSDVTIPLAAAIRAHGEELTVLMLRQPTPADARALKALPYMIGADESINVNTDVCAKYIERLASIPPSSIEQLTMGDFNTLCWVVARFFLGSGSGASKS
ncbi:phage tail assembly protein [Burkholderia vietnamiensis]|uniref:phage tail assembly protein n=1 Tax=Burkholderia vietnamiensis TaxID=60552 RepID=UPI000841BF7F|nr:phage tail assembly protein [Burkholderia vietnamiensis]AOK40841.1 ArsR family transcriptional regulator [Burkholderia vietnamiensis]